MTPRRRTLILVLLTIVSASVIAFGMDVIYQATIGYNRKADLCVLTPPHDRVAAQARGVAVKDRWAWLPPGHDVACVYRLPGGRSVARAH